MSDKRIINNTQAHRFEIFVDDELAGYAEYRQEDSSVAFTHTIVEPQYKGKGVGSALANGALDAVREAGGSALPYCSFIRSYIQRRHPAYLELAPADHWDEFALTPGDPTSD